MKIKYNQGMTNILFPSTHTHRDTSRALLDLQYTHGQFFMGFKIVQWDHLMTKRYCLRT